MCTFLTLKFMHCTLLISFPGNCKFTVLDIVIIVGDSGSVCDNDNFSLRDRNGDIVDCNNWSFLKLFIRQILTSLTLGDRDTRVALIRFSNRIDVIFGLDR